MTSSLELWPRLEREIPLAATEVLTFLKSLAEPERSALLGRRHSTQRQTGEMLVRRGDHADSAILRSGLLKIHTPTAGGDDVVLPFAGPGDLLGEVIPVRDAARSPSETAMEHLDGVVIAVTHAAVVPEALSGRDAWLAHGVVPASRADGRRDLGLPRACEQLRGRESLAGVGQRVRRCHRGAGEPSASVGCSSARSRVVVVIGAVSPSIRLS